MNTLLNEVAKTQREKTPFCERFIEFLRAGLDKATMDTVNYNIIAQQERKGMLKTDRHFEHYPDPASKAKPMSKLRFDTNEAAIMQNKSDAQVLEQMRVFMSENFHGMDEEAQGWFDYVVSGIAVPGRAGG